MTVPKLEYCRYCGRLTRNNSAFCNVDHALKFALAITVGYPDIRLADPIIEEEKKP